MPYVFGEFAENIFNAVFEFFREEGYKPRMSVPQNAIILDNFSTNHSDSAQVIVFENTIILEIRKIIGFVDVTYTFDLRDPTCFEQVLRKLQTHAVRQDYDTT